MAAYIYTSVPSNGATNQIYAQLRGMNTEYSGATRSLAWYLGNTLKTTVTISGAPENSATYTFSGLSAGTTYTIKARVYTSTWESWFETTETTNSATPTITPFSWGTTASSNGSATATETRNAYKAVNNRTAVSNFSYKVWNDMVDKVLEIFDANGWTWSTTYATAANTKMSSSSKTLTAKRFNSLRYNIGSHYSTGISTVSSGDIVYGSYFNTLVNCMNALI